MEESLKDRSKEKEDFGKRAVNISRRKERRRKKSLTADKHTLREEWSPRGVGW